jgi:hypothetical protein
MILRIIEEIFGLIMLAEVLLEKPQTSRKVYTKLILIRTAY